MESDSECFSLAQWLGAWALVAGACCPLPKQPAAEHAEKTHDNGKGEGMCGA